MLVKQSPGVLSLQPREEVPCTGTKVGSLQGGKESSGLGMGVGRSRAPALLQERPAGRERGGPSLGPALPFCSPHLPGPWPSLSLRGGLTFRCHVPPPLQWL